MPTLVKKLNLVLRGWGHYHRQVVASETFARIDKYVHEQLSRMLRHRHPKKSKPDLFRKYWTGEGGRHIFTVRQKTGKGPRVYTVIRLGALPSVVISRSGRTPIPTCPNMPGGTRRGDKRRSDG